MAERPQRPDLGRVLADLGATFLEPVTGSIDRSKGVGGVVIYDPNDDAALPDSSIVLGVGVTTPEEITEALAELRSARAAALVIRSPVSVTDEVTATSRRAEIPVIGLAPGAAWIQLASMLRTLLADDALGDIRSDSLGGVASGDLFALANSITALIDVPVTIEDRNSRVLAFSARQDEADSSRVETILGRQVPERFTRSLIDKGVFGELYASDEPVWIHPEPPNPDQLPRVAVAVRAGDEILGSIWAAVREPLSEDRLHALSDAAKLVALHMMTIRNGEDVARRLQADLVATALGGGAGTRDALRRLRLMNRGVVVLAMDLIGAEEDTIASDADRAAERQRLAAGFAMHLSASHPRSAVALVGDVCYALVPIPDGTAAPDHITRVSRDFLNRSVSGPRAVIGIGTVAHDPDELARARTNADRALRVLVEERKPGQIAHFEDVHMQSLLLDLRDLVWARGDEPSGPVARLIAHDREHNSQLVDTLRAWLDAFGDVPTAAAALYVHPNTFRYRLKRVTEVGGIDLTDPEARLAALLQLRVIHDR